MAASPHRKAPASSHVSVLQQGLALLQQGRLIEAEFAFTSVLAGNPGSFDALQLLAALRMQQGRLPETLDLIGRAYRYLEVPITYSFREGGRSFVRLGRYLRAVGYATKSKRGALPKMVLLGDIVGEDEAAVAAAASEVVRLANARSGEGFTAVSAEARRRFWLDRAKTAAIAKHTNAFKINEDVVIPLERLGEYTDAIERINIELSIQNKLELTDALHQFFTKTEQGKRTRATYARALLYLNGKAWMPTTSNLVNCVGIQAVTNARRLGAMLREHATGVHVVEPAPPRQASLFGDE